MPFSLCYITIWDLNVNNKKSFLPKRYTRNVRFSYSEDGGQHFFDPITINDNRDITGYHFEALVVNQKGMVFMAWLDKRDRFKALQNVKIPSATLYYSY